jgi:molybdenum cofactor cytidylyltransferase
MPPRHFALIPAAGQSLRMGQPKLLLPLGGGPLIATTIAAWQRSRVDRVLVVVRPDDGELIEVLRQTGVEAVVPPAPPPDMKASLQAALRHIERLHAPTADDAFLVAPADMPRLSPAIVDRLIERHAHSPDARTILAPTLAGRRGHPVLFPWPLAAEVHLLGENEGLNTIVERRQPLLVSCDDLVTASEQPFADVDTPDDFERLTKGPNPQKSQ